MLRFCDLVLDFTDGLTFEEFIADAKTYYATIHAIETLGVAAQKIPEEVQTMHPEIPWTEIRGMRNRLAHQYSQIDNDIVWTVVKRNIPALQPQLRALLSDDARENR